MEKTSETLTRFLWVAIPAGVGLAVTHTAGPRDDVQIILWLLLALLAAFGLWAVGAREKRRERERADKLRDTALLLIMRQKLVSEHDRLMLRGWADYTSRVAWESSYEAYEMLCTATNTPNGVMDDYAQDISDLPSMT